MSIRTNGAEWKAFCASRAAGWSCRGERIIADDMLQLDKSKIEDSTVLTIVCGTIDEGQGTKSLEAVYRRWRSRSGVTHIIVEVPKGKEGAVRDAAEKAGGRVLG